jgi:hypothetical protein
MTLEEQIALAEQALATAAEEAKMCYKIYREADDNQTRIADELKALRRQQREGTR